MLIDLIKDSIALRDDDKYIFYTENDGGKLNKKIIENHLTNKKNNEASDTLYHLNIDTYGIFPSFTLSVVNRPFVKNSVNLIKLANETSVRFNKTNVNFHIIDKMPIILITTSFFFLDEIEDLLFKNGIGFSDYNKDEEESKAAVTKISSIIGSMVIELLEASMFIDEKSLEMVEGLMKDAGKDSGE